METKPKVNVQEIVERSKNKHKVVVSKDEVKKENFNLVPGFTKYEFNGNILRNSKTKNIISFKTGRTKYQIVDDKGNSKNLSKDEIKALMPAKSVKHEKVKKEAKQVKENPVHVSSDEDKKKVDDLSKKEILDLEGPKHKKIYMLFLKGCDFAEIQSLTKSPMPSIKRDIWRHQTGKTTL